MNTTVRARAPRAPSRVRSERQSLSNCANAASTPSINLPVDVSSIGSVADRKEMPSDFRCDRSAKWSYFFAREPCEVEDNNEVNLALVRPAVLEEPLQLRTVGRLCAFAFFPEPLENLVPLPAAVLLARTKLRGQAQILGAFAGLSEVLDHHQILAPTHDLCVHDRPAIGRESRTPEHIAVPHVE